MRAYVAAIFALALVGCVSSTEFNGPLAPPVERITGWTEPLSWRPGRNLFLRNNTSRIVDITFITLTECENVKGGCTHWDPGITLYPGEWRKVKTVLPARDGRPFNLRWQWGSSDVEEAGRDSVAGGEALPEPGPRLELDELRVGRFDVGPDDAYGLTGHYLGRISIHGDTITVQVESGQVRNRIFPDGPQMRLVGIRLGLRPWINEGAGGLVASGKAEELQIDLGPEERKAVGAFELSVVYDKNLIFAHKLFFIHEVQMEDGRRARTFTFFPGTMGDLIWGKM